jgi:hypothetical protein
MFANGHRLVMDRALDELGDDAELREHYDALLLGNLREDVYKFPFTKRFMLGKGLTHYYRPGRVGGVWFFVPSAPRRTGWLFERAVRLHRAGRPRDAWFALGRAIHLLSEMAAPVHSSVVLHWYGDPFELYVEANARELRKLPLPALPAGAARARTAAELVHLLAVYSRQFPCDRTRNLPGWLAWKSGLLRRPADDVVVSQVRALIPMGAAFTLAMLRLFLAAVRPAQARAA